MVINWGGGGHGRLLRPASNAFIKILYKYVLKIDCKKPKRGIFPPRFRSLCFLGVFFGPFSTMILVQRYNSIKIVTLSHIELSFIGPLTSSCLHVYVLVKYRLSKYTNVFSQFFFRYNAGYVFVLMLATFIPTWCTKKAVIN